MLYRFVQFGAFFATRERGAEVRRDIEARLRELPPQDPLMLDFEGVQAISFSFADEVVGRLMEERKGGTLSNRLIYLFGLENEEIHDPIERSFIRRGLMGCACRKGELATLLGASEHITDTYRAAQKRHTFQTPELAADLGISIQACNNRLRPLIEAGVLLRAGGGRGHAFTYRSAFSC